MQWYRYSVVFSFVDTKIRQLWQQHLYLMITEKLQSQYLQAKSLQIAVYPLASDKTFNKTRAIVICHQSSLYFVYCGDAVDSRGRDSFGGGIYRLPVGGPAHVQGSILVSTTKRCVNFYKILDSYLLVNRH